MASDKQQSWGLMPICNENRVLAYQGGGLVPDGWTVILSNESENRLVLFHPETQQIALRRASNTTHSETDPKGAPSPQFCPLCNSQIESNVETGAANAATTAQSRLAFVDPNYFALLTGAFKAEVPRNASLSLEFGSRQQRRHSLSADAFIDGYYARFFEEIKKIGSGQRGQVYLCRHVIEGEVLGEFAVKKIPIGDNYEWFLKMLTEVHMLERLHHTNIVNYKHAWLETAQLAVNAPPVPCLFILIEYANSGNLAQHLFCDPELLDLNNDRLHDSKDSSGRPSLTRREQVKRRLAKEQAERLRGSQNTTNVDFSATCGRVLEDEEIVSLFSDFMLGLNHLHRHGLIHRDLKPQNLLLHRYTKDQRYLSVLVSDFGECELMHSLGVRRRGGHTGTIEYMAPELLIADRHGEFRKDYDQKSDMWSAGIILHMLMYGCLPWSADLQDVATLRREITSVAVPLVPPKLANGGRRSLHLQSLLSHLLNPDPESRPSTTDVLKMLSVTQPGTWASNVPSSPKHPNANNSDSGMSARHRAKKSRLTSLQALPSTAQLPARDNLLSWIGNLLGNISKSELYRTTFRLACLGAGSFVLIIALNNTYKNEKLPLLTLIFLSCTNSVCAVLLTRPINRYTKSFYVSVISTMVAFLLNFRVSLLEISIVLLCHACAMLLW